MSLTPTIRRTIESYVRPLYVELDGVDTFASVAQRGDVVEELAGELVGERQLDRDFLDLLLLFHGTVKGLGSTDPGGRWWLFLRGLGLRDETIGRLSIGLGRWRQAPQGPEEEALHDAELLEEVGIVACARRLWRAGRKRVPLSRAVATLDAGPAPERFKTVAGRRLAGERRVAARAWIEALRDAAGHPRD